MDQMLDRLVGHEYYFFLYGYLGYNQITISLEDHEKTTFMCPYDICVQADAIWVMQRIGHILMMHDGHIFQHGREDN